MITTEMEIEKHPFPPFIPENATTLIIGSFPAMKQSGSENDSEQWFYGSADNLFWPILSEVFQTELKTVKQKKEFFEQQGIAITDIFTKIRRKKKGYLDKDLEIIEYNSKIDSIISESVITKLLFTSKFVEKHFLREFQKIKFGVCLPSPSQAANIPISMSDDFKRYKLENPNGNTYSFRVYKYKQLLA